MTDGRARILVVDDKENMRKLLRDILGPRHDVALAASVVEAAARLRMQHFSLVLTDIRMHGPDGFELLRLVKERWAATEVVMMTAYASIPAAVEAIRQGAYDYIEKPFDPDDVTLVVERALTRQRENEAEPPSAARATTPLEEDLAALSYREALASARDRGSREYLTALLKAFEGNVSQAAEHAGLERESLHRLLRRYRIHADAFRDPAQRANDE